MLTNIRYILLTALRDKLFIGLLVGVLAAAGISAMLGGTSFIEEREMTITYATGASRVMLMIGLIVFVCFHIRTAFDSKEIDVILSRPISRASLVLSYWLGFSQVAFFLCLPIIFVLLLMGVPQWLGFWGWASSLFLEALLVVALALFAAFTLRSAVTSVLACMGFYVLSRMMVFFVMTAESPAIRDTALAPFRYMLTIISTLVPRLDFFAHSEWLVYGFDNTQDWLLSAGQAAVFVPLLLFATMIDLSRKQF